MFKAIQWRAFALLLAFFFAAVAHASSEAISQTPIVEAHRLNPKANNAVIKQSDLAPLPNAVTAPPANPTVTTPNMPALTEVGKPIEGKPDAGKPDAGKPGASNPGTDTPNAGKPSSGEPSAGNSSDIFADLSASKRLAISVLAGVFTLIAALWIGARRD